MGLFVRPRIGPQNGQSSLPVSGVKRGIRHVVVQPMVRNMRPRKGPNGLALPAGGRAVRLGLAAPWINVAARAATSELIVSDQTGIALYGFDPVAFFLDHTPRRGLPAFELSHAGVVFRFRNEGNRAAFKANPGVYLPRFGGYDPDGDRGAARPRRVSRICSSSGITGCCFSRTRKAGKVFSPIPRKRSRRRSFPGPR